MESSPDGCKSKFVVTFLKFSDIIGKNFKLQCCVQWLQIHEHNKLINYFYMFHMSFYNLHLPKNYIKQSKTLEIIFKDINKYMYCKICLLGILNVFDVELITFIKIF